MEDLIDVTASPAKKQRHEGAGQKRKSYAAVVRESLKDVSSNPQQSDSTASSSATAPSTAKMEKVRRTLVVEADDVVIKSKKRPSSATHHASHAYSVSGGVQPYLRQLDEYLELEIKYRGSVPFGSGASGSNGANADPSTITRGMRDGSAHVLRCLKVWYDLPSDVFFNAISSIDRFLSKMKAQPKHLSCIAVASFHLACQQYRQEQEQRSKVTAVTSSAASAPSTLINVPEPSDLVTISQSRCSSSDLMRMQTILSSKLEMNPSAGPIMPVTSLSYLRLMFWISQVASMKLGLDDLLPAMIPDQLIQQLEILACDSVTLQFRSAEVALALLTTDFQQRVGKQPVHSSALMGFISELQKYCNIPSASFVSCLQVVMNLLDKYNGECTVAHRQRLVWKLSNRTLRHLRPTDKLRATLPTIDESARFQSIRNGRDGSHESLESLSLSSEEGCCCSDSEMDIEDKEE